MALLRNLEQSLSGLVEGTVGRVFRTEVRPTEIARKLAREMEINKRVSLSRTYAPTDYLVWLSPEDRSRYVGVEHSIAEELGAYLLEHARRERLVLVRRPLVEFRTDQRLKLGEFGIEARTAPISAEEAPPRNAAPAPVEREERRPRHEARQAPPQAAIYDDDPDPAPPAPEAALPIGAAPIEEPPAPAFEAEHDAPYADPYANDFGGGDDSAEIEWEDAPPRDERRPRPEPADAEFHAVDDADFDFEDDAPAPAESVAAPSAPEASPDWLDPVEDWNAPPAPATPVAEEPPPPAPEAPRRVEPHPPAVPAPAPQVPAPMAGAPWIDPTLQRQKRAQFAPPVIPATQPAKPVAPRQPDTMVLVDGTPHELHGDLIVLGRSRTADITVSDPSISRRHVELRRDDRGWYAIDLGSTNGSQIDGTPLTEPRRLQPGQRIKLGHADAIIEVR